MILDTTAVIAILFQEPGFEALIQNFSDTGTKGIGVPTLVECGIVLSARFNRDSRGLVNRFLREAAVIPIPLTEVHFGMAVGAWLKNGRGHHPAGLNFGVCLAHAVARLADMPLLYIGDHFPQTDLSLA